MSIIQNHPLPLQSGFTLIEIMLVVASVGWAFSPAKTLQG